ncbi:MAG: methylglyoxal synthase [Bacteroidetes bacterium]|jgi:methylglyoxal synthase|nr:MAG: methylglyoxal synthase [Bacteroidota bacterium]
MKVALVAHDSRKKELAEWVGWNWKKLISHDLICTGTTGRIVEAELRSRLPDDVERHISLLRLKSGPLGGDQQLGAMICEGKIDFFVFFWDPMSAQPHDVDVKALLRIAVLYNIPTASNRCTADYLISSPWFDEEHPRSEPDFSDYLNRSV